MSDWENDPRTKQMDAEILGAMEDLRQARAEVAALREELAEENRLHLLKVSQRNAQRDRAERAERERDEARAMLTDDREMLCGPVVDALRAAEQDAARLGAALRDLLEDEDALSPVWHESYDTARAALAAHEERVRGGGA